MHTFSIVSVVHIVQSSLLEYQHKCYNEGKLEHVVSSVVLKVSETKSLPQVASPQMWRKFPDFMTLFFPSCG
jgi:hypothetical protein